MADGRFQPFPVTRFGPWAPETGPNDVFAHETPQSYGKRALRPLPELESLVAKYQGSSMSLLTSMLMDSVRRTLADMNKLVFALAVLHL